MLLSGPFGRLKPIYSSPEEGLGLDYILIWPLWIIITVLTIRVPGMDLEVSE
jgi:hypothetical protein